METNFDFKQYLGVYNDVTGVLRVINVYTDEVFVKAYANKHSARRGFVRLMKMLEMKKGK